MSWIPHQHSASTILFVAVYVTRQTGVIAGPNLTVMDDVLIAVSVYL